MNSGSKNKMAVCLNSAIIVLEILAVFLNTTQRSLPAIAFYTILSNLAAFIASVLFLFSQFSHRGHRLAVIARYAGTLMLLVTFCVVAFILVRYVDPVSLFFSRNNFIHHLIVPVLAFVSYVFFEDKITWKREMLPPIILTTLYATVMDILNAMGIADGPYPFFMVHRVGWGKVILYYVLIFTGMILIACALYRVPRKKA